MKRVPLESIMDVLDSWERRRIQLQAVADAVHNLLGPLLILLEALKVLDDIQEVEADDQVREPDGAG